MYVWDYVVDALFVLDIVALFYVASTPKTCYLATDRQRNVLHYGTSRKLHDNIYVYITRCLSCLLTLVAAWGWFMVDLAASLPLDLFIWAANGTQGSHAAPMQSPFCSPLSTARDFTRLLKLLHLFRLYRALHQLSSRAKERWNTYNEKWILYNPNIERLVAMILFIYMVRLCLTEGRARVGMCVHR